MIDQAKSDTIQKLFIAVQKNKKDVISLQKKETAEEQVWLQNLLDFVEHSLAI